MDKLRFTQEVKARERQLYRIAKSYLSNDDDCADAVQEALMRAWAKRATLRNETLFGTWLVRILINECKTLLRKRRRCTPMADVPETNEMPPPPQPSALETQIRSMPAMYSVPLVLSVLDGYTYQEVASILRLPLGTVKTRVSRAKQQLRIKMREVNDDEA